MGPSSGCGDQTSTTTTGLKARLPNGFTTTSSKLNGNAIHTTPKTSSSTTSNKADDSTRSLAMLIVIFLASALALCYVYFMFPKLDEAERQHVKFPFNIDDAKKLANVLDRYKDLYPIEVMGGIVLAYIL